MSASAGRVPVATGKIDEDQLGSSLSAVLSIGQVGGPHLLGARIRRPVRPPNAAGLFSLPPRVDRRDKRQIRRGSSMQNLSARWIHHGRT